MGPAHSTHAQPQTSRCIGGKSHSLVIEREGVLFYEISTDSRAGIKSVLDFGADAVILGADPPELDCCNLLSEIKGSERTQNIRVLMLSRGGSAERTRGLDLGADEVRLPDSAHKQEDCSAWARFETELTKRTADNGPAFSGVPGQNLVHSQNE